MTFEQIAIELERVKELTNEEGKGIVTRLQVELRSLREAPVELKVIEKEVVAPGDRRSEVRDPGEHDQTVAVKLGLTRKKKVK